MVFTQTEVVTIPNSLQVITDDFDLRTITTADAIFAAVSIVAAVVLSIIAKRALRRVLNKVDGLPVLAGDVIARIVSYTILLLGLVLALEALGFSLGPVGSLFVIVIVMIVVAARPLIQDLGAGLIIQMRRPFGVRDQVRLDGCEGEVEEVSARTVRIIAVDGRRIHIPNRRALDESIINLTSEGRRMTMFTAGVAYDTDLDRAREVIVQALGSAPGVLSDPPPQAFVEEFSDSTIKIACRFWHAPEIEAEWAARDEAMRSVKRAFNANGITIAFPQRVLWTGESVT
ncbi:MAG: mechanosensitive ion channel family protein [Acidimicrobiales bacterium]